MTNLVTHHVEECHQVRGRPRKLTQAPIVIPTLIPTWHDSCNLPLIVLEAFKDILCDSSEARTTQTFHQPTAAISRTSSLSLRVHPRILTGYHFRGYQSGG